MTLEQLTAACLADPSHNGIYRLTQGAPAESPELCLRTLAPLPRIDRARLLAALGETLAFPDYYGQNWDAAWDCLTELQWPTGQLLAIRVSITAEHEVVENDLEVFLELMTDACQHWAERGQALCLLVESAQTGLLALQAALRGDVSANQAPKP